MPRFKTEIVKSSDYDIACAAELLKKGEVIGMPTETVYGLAGNALDQRAIEKIFKAKGRPQDNPLIVHIATVEMMEKYAVEIPKIAYLLVEKFWPGPLTMVLQKSELIPNVTSGGLDTIGVRMPKHKVALEIIAKSGLPIAAPSANISGSPSPTTANHVFLDMDGKIPMIVDGGACEGGVESTVISFEGEDVRILRPGLITPEMLSQVARNVIVDSSATHELDNNTEVKSPGMKYKHYSPKAEVTIISGSDDEIARFYKENNNALTEFVLYGKITDTNIDFIHFGETSQQQANRLFDILREADRNNKKSIYFKKPIIDGVGLAVYNRLLRAAAFKEIKLDSVKE